MIENPCTLFACSWVLPTLEAAAIFVVIGLWREFIRYIDKENR